MEFRIMEINFTKKVLKRLSKLDFICYAGIQNLGNFKIELPATLRILDADVKIGAFSQCHSKSLIKYTYKYI
jgi:hypothetical protein